MAPVAPVGATVVVTRALLISLALVVMVAVLAMLFVPLVLGPLAVPLLSVQGVVVELLVY